MEAKAYINCTMFNRSQCLLQSLLSLPQMMSKQQNWWKFSVLLSVFKTIVVKSKKMSDLRALIYILTFRDLYKVEDINLFNLKFIESILWKVKCKRC